jgi:hypothetical protein
MSLFINLDKILIINSISICDNNNSNSINNNIQEYLSIQL